VLLTAVMEQRVNVKFCVKLGKTLTETDEMLRTVCGDEALSRSSVFELFKDERHMRSSIGSQNGWMN
jgi:hypothetical protein